MTEVRKRYAPNTSEERKYANELSQLKELFFESLELKSKDTLVEMFPGRTSRYRRSRRDESDWARERLSFDGVRSETIDVLAGGADDGPENFINLMKLQEGEGWGALGGANKAVIASPFPIVEEMGVRFLSEEMKKLQFDGPGWGDLYVCAFLCSRMGVGDRAAVIVDREILRDRKHQSARVALVKSGHLRRVIFPRYGRPYGKSCVESIQDKDALLSGKAILILDMEQPESGEVVFMVTRLWRRQERKVPYPSRRQETVSNSSVYGDSSTLCTLSAEEIFERDALLDFGEAWRRRLLRCWPKTLQERFNIEQVPSFSAYNLSQMRGQTSGARARVLSPTDFGTEGLLVPRSANSQGGSCVLITEEMRDRRALREGDILIARMGSGKRPYIVPSVEGDEDFDAYLAGDNFLALRLVGEDGGLCKPEDAALAAAVIRGLLVDWQIRIQSNGPRAVLTATDLLDVVVPDLEPGEDLDCATELSRETAEAHAKLESALREYSAKRSQLDALIRKIENDQGFD